MTGQAAESRARPQGARTGLRARRPDPGAAVLCRGLRDHVGDRDYHGLDGVRRSTELYRLLFDELAFEVVDQVAEGDRVANR
jgi:hypothetical protein